MKMYFVIEDVLNKNYYGIKYVVFALMLLRYCIKIFFAILIRITILLEITFVTYLMSTCRRALYHIAGKTEFVEKMTINRKCRDRNVKRVI